jgi:hypothetical protein
MPEAKRARVSAGQCPLSVTEDGHDPGLQEGFTQRQHTLLEDAPPPVSCSQRDQFNCR